MKLHSIAIRNVRLHLSRTVLMLLVIAISVAVVMALYLVTRSAERDLADKIDEYGANIVVVPRSKDLPLTYGDVAVSGVTYETEPLHESDVDIIRSIRNSENINKVAPKLVQAAEVRAAAGRPPAGASDAAQSGDAQPADARLGDAVGEQMLAVGVRWEEELGLKKWWTIEGEAPASDGDVIVGSRAASLLAVLPGDSLEVEGEPFRVAGVLSPMGTGEDGAVFLDLGAAQRIWDRPDEVSFIEVSAWCSTCPIETITAQIKAEMPYARASAVRKAIEAREMVVNQFRLFSAVLSALMGGVGLLIVLVSTLGSVRDRRGEIGIFRSVGYRRRHVFQIVLLENLSLAAVGAVAGILAATLVAGPLAIAVAGVDQAVAPSALELAAAFGAAVAAVLAASVYPAWRASLLSPLLAMKPV